MVKQRIPDIDFDKFVLGEIKDLFDEGKIKINTEYQRGDIWTSQQRIELIKSIENSYSIGILVLFVNEKKEFEILDGQQRLLTINKYLKDELKDLEKVEIKKYSKLNKQDKILIDSYCIYYLKLKSFNEETKEEDISQTFLRLQEGSPLNKAEKINAHRGLFKDTFRKLRETHPFFNLLEPDKRFRLRLLAAEFLLLELKSDLKNKVFPGLTLNDFKNVINEYRKKISERKIKFLNGNLHFLNNSLNNLLTARPFRDLISFYLLISYLRENKAENKNLLDEFRNFTEEFLKNLHSFSIYDQSPPSNLTQNLFDKYKKYKQEARKATSPDSIKYRFEFVLEEFNRLNPFIKKDKKRLHDTSQKRTLFFRQKGLCPKCKKRLDFRFTSSDHKIAHFKGGKTDSLKEAQLLHESCHRRLEKRRKKINKQS